MLGVCLTAESEKKLQEKEIKELEENEKPEYVSGGW